VQQASSQVSSLCKAVGEFAVACSSLVRTLVEREGLRRSALQQGVARIEAVACRTARHVSLEQKGRAQQV
jgi:hypothetical protein